VVRTPARVLAVPLATALILVAGCAGGDPAVPAAAPVLAGGEIELVDAPASSAGLTGDGRGEAPAPAVSTEPAAPVTTDPAPVATTEAVPTEPSAVATEPKAPAKWVQLSVNKAGIGETVTDVTGFALYTFTEDPTDPSASQCTGDCARTWPPLLIQPGGRVFVDGMKTDDIAAIRRPDGGVQVTIGGHPAYRFSGDTVPGDLNGHGADGAWFAFAPDGKAIDALIGAAQLKATKPDRTGTLTAKNGKDGPIVVDDAGATLYRFDQDDTDPPASSCTGACAALWQPVVAKNGGKVNLKGIDADRVWWLSRKDGTKQVTLDGSPLYRNVADKSTDTIVSSAAVQGWTAAR
jgi:predicted lipoprotein with Yx(FWY)xxD motif